MIDMPRTAAPARTRATAAKPAARTTRAAATSKKTAVPAKTTRKPAAPAKPTRTRAAAPSPAAKTRATRAAAPVAKKAPARRQAAAPKQVAPPVAMGRETDELTGFQVGTDSHLAAQELMKGGLDRQDIIDRMKEILDPATKNGTEKPVANIVAATMRKLIARGFTVDSSFVMVPPQPRAKRATRRK